MGLAGRIFYGAVAALSSVALCIIAYESIFNLLEQPQKDGSVKVDYNTILTVLLTTVTVIFTVCAIVLTVLGIIGFRNLKKDAGKFAESQALAEIRKAFESDGRGTLRIKQEMLEEGGHHRLYVEQRIRSEVISLLPLIADRLNTEALSLALDEPTDEGIVD